MSELILMLRLPSGRIERLETRIANEVLFRDPSVVIRAYLEMYKGVLDGFVKAVKEEQHERQ